MKLILNTLLKLPLYLMVIAITFIFIACKKDKKNPVLNLIGDAILEITYDSIALDPGAEAIDETDGNITNKIISDWSTKVNIKQRASYIVSYKIADKRANESQAKREVIVRMCGSNFIGNYNSAWALTGTSYTGTSLYSVTAGAHRNQFIIYPYGPHQIALKVNLSGDFGESLDFNQSDIDVLTEGSGTIENNGATIKLNFRRTYTNGAVIHGTETLIRI
ncbi:MAG TPA: DUF5011 domain-containing protein [Bacteroidia bacterium]|nr:DUF5011 domain-containing protein [Bacteroidia bacterium]